MSTSTAPDLPGYTFRRELGQGGFADVYLFAQHLPAREVAVKVLRQTRSTPAARERFENEANRMAMLSAHPSIVTIYAVGVSSDDRPFITMEYCPNDHFGQIATAQPLSVARALEVGIKIAGAVETAHRASIMHRDLKPANVLLTSYGEPALTDFGIAGGGIVSTASTASDGESQGVSIPFGAPEVLTGSTAGDARADVYSLAATVYALLAGRAPFTGAERSSERDLIERVLHAPLPPTGRGDVPANLERVLGSALARDPANRYDSAASFGRALQGIEAELALAQTTLPVAAGPNAAGAPASPEAPDDDGTRMQPLQRVDPDGTPAADVPWELEGPRAHLPGGALGDRTVARGQAASEPDPTEQFSAPDAPTRRRPTVLLIVAGLVVVLAGAFLFSKVGDSGSDVTATTTTVPTDDSLATSGAPPKPEDVRIERFEAGGQAISWTAPSDEGGDAYQVFFTDGPSDLEGRAETTQGAQLPLDTDDRVCVTVETVRGGRVSAASAEVCSP